MTAPAIDVSGLPAVGRGGRGILLCVTALTWTAAAGAWLAAALGRPPAPAGSRTLVALAAIATLALAGGAIRSVVTGRTALPAATGRWLLGILLLALVLSFVGLDHEVTGRDYGDEGIYRAHAERINDGRLLHPSFIYPHLLYYLDAVALWIADLFPDGAARLAGLWDVEGELAVASLVTRMVTALLAALTVWPAFWIGRRLVGDAAGLLGAGWVAVCPLWVANGHLNLSDVPAAVFATACLAAVAALLEEERPGLYVLGGIAAGLAAGGKYPAGVVAVALVAVWIRWRLRTRRWSWGLIVAGALALVTFLATTPSLLAFPDAVYRGEGSKDLFFGLRQYATRGWTGVVHESNVRYYAEQLAWAFGLPALVLGIAGAFGLTSPERRRLGWILVFPLVHLLLLVQLRVAVPRNLLPLVPVLAVAIGCGWVGAWRWARRGRPRRVTIGAALALALAVPAWRTAREVALLTRPTTRELAAAWIAAHLPPGSLVVHEAYTPAIRSPLLSRRARFVSRLAPDVLRHPTHDYVLVASAAYGRFLHPRNLERPAYEDHAGRYREILDTFPLVHEVRPGPWRGGPVLGLYRLDPVSVVHVESRTWSASEAVLPDDSMRGPGAIRYTRPGQWSLFKEYLQAGAYRFGVAGRLSGPARVVVRDRVDSSRQEELLLSGEPVRVDVLRGEKAFVYLYARDGSRVTAVTMERVGEAGEGVP
jgi:4-amino-4-deoxy-L-arabinose transferase-like glycosyltransferase